MTRPRDESPNRQEQNDLAFRLRQARGLRTMFAIVPDAGPGFDFLALFGVVAVVSGAFYGGYCCGPLGLDVAQATRATAYATWAMFNIAGDFIRHSPDKCRLKATLRLFVVIGKPGSPRTRLRRV